MTIPNTNIILYNVSFDNTFSRSDITVYENGSIELSNIFYYYFKFLTSSCFY